MFVLNRVKQRPVAVELESPLCKLEIVGALGRLRNGITSGASNILPDMLKAGKEKKLFVQMIQDLMKSVWEERAVPKEWVDAVIVPILKKGNLHSCDNWCEIALLEVVGKVVARVVHTRAIAEFSR